jgi:hypothetical protein
MADKKQEPIPELSDDIKVKILLIQRQILGTQQSLTLLKNALGELIEQIAKDLSIDGSKLTFDLDNLKIVPKK